MSEVLSTVCQDERYRELFYGSLQEMDQAAQLCSGCPLFDGCREQGFTTTYGVWGGLTPGARRKLDGPARQRALRAEHSWSKKMDEQALALRCADKVAEPDGIPEEDRLQVANEPIAGDRRKAVIEKCNVNDCSDPGNNRGFCRSHYLKWYRHGDPLYVSPHARYNTKYGDDMLEQVKKIKTEEPTLTHRQIGDRVGLNKGQIDGIMRRIARQ